MANFSVNQVRHLYVALANGTADEKTKVLANDAELGAILPCGDEAKKTLYFSYKGHGGLERTDLINTDSIMCIKHVKAETLETNLMKAEVKLSSEVNDGKPIPGQDYILRVVFRQYAGMSDEDVYIKHAAVRAYTGMEASDFYKKLAISLAKNFSRELTPLLSFEMSDGTVVTGLTKESELTGTYDSVVIKEVAQDWTLGVKAQEPVYFDVYPTYVTFDGDEVIWGEVDENTGKIELEAYDTLGNGKKIADLEYFCHGERGDIYRNVGWPDVIPTKYYVDPEKTYDVLEIHYAFKGGAENPQLSEKDLEIVAEPEVMSALVTALKDKLPEDLKDIKVVEKN